MFPTVILLLSDNMKAKPTQGGKCSRVQGARIRGG